MQRPIPCFFMRGGTSHGPFFRAVDLPTDIATRDRVLLAVMGSPDARQIDGIGGADPLTSKVGIVSPGTDGVDLEFLFAQVSLKEPLVDTTPNCGNMLAAVVPFAIESGMVAARGDVTTLRVLTKNTGTLCDIEVQTPGGRVEYAGDARIDGVPGTAAPVNISFLDTAGSVCGALLPTGNLVDRFDGVDVTCIDNGMPVVVMLAADLGVTGYETRDELNANERTQAAHRIDPAAGRPRDEARRRGEEGGAEDVPGGETGHFQSGGGHITTRTFIPHDCHSAVGVLGAVTVATAAVMPGTWRIASRACHRAARKTFSVQHPSGEFTVVLEMSEQNPAEVARASLLRTARLIMRGEVFIPALARQSGRKVHDRQIRNRGAQHAARAGRGGARNSRSSAWPPSTRPWGAPACWRRTCGLSTRARACAAPRSPCSAIPATTGCCTWPRSCCSRATWWYSRCRRRDDHGFFGDLLATSFRARGGARPHHRRRRARHLPSCRP